MWLLFFREFIIDGPVLIILITAAAAAAAAAAAVTAIDPMSQSTNLIPGKRGDSRGSHTVQ